MRKLSVLALGCALSMLASCASPGPVGLAPGIEVAELTSLPAPEATDHGTSGPDRLRPLDRLRIDVFGVPELNREVQVNADGTIMFPFVGPMDVRGLTPAAVAQEIESRLRGDYVRNPEVTVQTTERQAQLITVGGEIASPGQYAVTGPSTLLEAVALGGGPTEFARLDDVLVFRTIGSQRYIGVYNLGAIQRGNYADPTLYPNDLVMVGNSPNRRLLAEIARITSVVSTPLILLERVAR